MQRVRGITSPAPCTAPARTSTRSKLNCADIPRLRVLDLGCGGGHVSYRAAPLVAQVVACDITQSMLDEVARTAAERGLTNVIVRQAAAEKLPFESGSFDVVLCRFTAHHWQAMEAGLREARRVLKNSGRAVFVDTIAPADPDARYAFAGRRVAA